MDFVKFIRDAAKRTRLQAANINPCADAGDRVKSALLERAGEWDACADEMERLQKQSAICDKESLIKHMVDRFLIWKLPADFQPDCGIEFDADAGVKIDPRNRRYEPVGTNLLNADQTRAMIRYLLDGLPEG